MSDRVKLESPRRCHVCGRMMEIGTFVIVEKIGRAYRWKHTGDRECRKISARLQARLDALPNITQ